MVLQNLQNIQRPYIGVTDCFPPDMGASCLPPWLHTYTGLQHGCLVVRTTPKPCNYSQIRQLHFRLPEWKIRNLNVQPAAIDLSNMGDVAMGQNQPSNCQV